MVERCESESNTQPLACNPIVCHDRVSVSRATCQNSVRGYVFWWDIIHSEYNTYYDIANGNEQLSDFARNWFIPWIVERLHKIRAIRANRRSLKRFIWGDAMVSRVPRPAARLLRFSSSMRRPSFPRLAIALVLLFVKFCILNCWHLGI